MQEIGTYFRFHYLRISRFVNSFERGSQKREDETKRKTVPRIAQDPTLESWRS